VNVLFLPTYLKNPWNTKNFTATWFRKNIISNILKIDKSNNLLIILPSLGEQLKGHSTQN